jgi:hypothetical protein
MKIGAVLQVVSFEIGVGCDLAAQHPQCPVHLGMDRYAHLYVARRLDGDAIMAVLYDLYTDYDFRGWVNFSHYNEPCLNSDDLLKYAKACAVIAPDCPRLLITNGRHIPAEVRDYGLFTQVHVTDYGGSHAPTPEALDALRAVTTVRVTPGKLDRRMRGPGPDRSQTGCLYPFSDLAVDHFGNLRLCCFDWQGLASPGNVFRDGLAACLRQWETVVRTVARPSMTADAPAVCRTCRHTHFQTLARTFIPARQAAKVWLKETA